MTLSVSSCGREKDNFDIDISKLNLPKKVIKSQPNDSEVKSDKESIIYKLKALKSKDEVINNPYLCALETKYGGHCGFFNSSGNRWHLKILLQFINYNLKKNNKE